MKNESTNEEELMDEINNIRFEGRAMSFDDSTSPESFIALKEDL